MKQPYFTSVRRGRYVALIVACWAVLANAQPNFTPIAIDNPTPAIFTEFGAAVASIGDVNGDSVLDVLIGAEQQDIGGNGGQGQAYVFSGTDGGLLYIVDNPIPQSIARFGFSVAGMGDVNTDGIPDLLVGAVEQDVAGTAGQGQAFVLSGVDGSLLYAVTTPTSEANANFGYAVSGVGDVNGDSISDLIVGAPDRDVGLADDQGQAFVFSGATGTLLYTLNDATTQADAFFGVAVAGVGDVNGDQVPDLLVGASGQDVGANINQGQAFVFSGATGNLLRIFNDPNPQEGALFGHALTDAGDVNGDGTSDLLISAVVQDVIGIPNQGQAFILDGATGALLRVLDDPEPLADARFGDAVAAAGDVNGDGTPDVLIGAPFSQEKAFVFSGADASLLRTLDKPTSQLGSFGDAVAGMGDVNGDGIPDLLVGAPNQNVGGNPGQGQAFLFVSTPTEVAVDILPKSINVHKQGVIPVAILTTSEFDATSVNPSSVRFGPANAAATQDALEDVDDDGDIDLLLKFNAPQTGIVCGSTQASLTGKTFDGEPVQGSDSFKTVGCPKP